nr:MAG TPA: hypothetical protein [Caudoviricetes sp.]
MRQKRKSLIIKRLQYGQYGQNASCPYHSRSRQVPNSLIYSKLNTCR